MQRKIVNIDKVKCIGCGLCVAACHEKAIELIEGKAQLIKDDYCDGLGDCLPHCPVDAIKIETRDAVPFDESLFKKKTSNSSRLTQWPVQIKLANVNASFFAGAHLLIAASCTAFAYADFHKDFMNKRVTLIGCPKLDGVDYSLKLTEIITFNNIKSITLVRMEVPCCSRLERDILQAIANSGKDLHFSVRVISTKGELV